ncbi:hypothetical protein OSSY52_14120 [Tepiditoga spiralis]|uniref:DUF2520 domain-containing protein n=1 Tax=Tepiditoga spiralis TaxID=2108365 RepID=A0A7G1G4H4_9BACT|nr:Rossmann-like and DUF2520 domain-containing protein [Tepiditoga spiralis]BBE31271.1 hypothetical protein OSSY52_14120 [Tepiditoga spiralis]
MKVNLIGPGKVGRSVLNYFYKNGYEKGLIIEKNKIDYKNFLFEGIILIGVPDDIIPNICYNLKKSSFKNVEALIHFSGFVDSSCFKDLSSKYKFSLHPNQSFNKVKDISNITWGIDGIDEKSINYAKKLVNMFNGRSLIIPKGEKNAYHLAAVIASNFSYALNFMSNKIYDSLNIKEREHLIDLAINSLNNIKEKGLKESLTGPVARKDTNTIAEERDAFNKYFGDKVCVYDFFVDLLKKISEN